MLCALSTSELVSNFNMMMSGFFFGFKRFVNFGDCDCGVCDTALRPETICVITYTHTQTDSRDFNMLIK